LNPLARHYQVKALLKYSMMDQEEKATKEDQEIKLPEEAGKSTNACKNVQADKNVESKDASCKQEQEEAGATSIPLPDSGVYNALPSEERLDPELKNSDDDGDVLKFDKIKSVDFHGSANSRVVENMSWSRSYSQEFHHKLLKMGWDTEECTTLTITDRQPQLYSLMSRACVGDGSLCNSFSVTLKSVGNLPKGMRRRGRTLFFDANLSEMKETNQVRLLLGLGIHEIMFEDEKILLLKQNLSRPTKEGCASSLVIFVKGKGRGKFMKRLCEYIYNVDSENYERVVNIYRYLARDMYWANSGTKYARSTESVVLPTKIKKIVMDDLTRFLSPKTHKFYFKHGIPYKRSYLFRGKPGAGKTSMIEALAGRFKRNLCQLQPAVPEMTDVSFATCLQTVPKDSMIVLEDIDALFERREKQEKSCPLTFSALLNGLDGISSPTAQIFIMTTNHPERLDPALVRSGRVDMHVEFSYATEEQIKMMFVNFYPNEEENAKAFSKKVVKLCRNGVTMAVLQQHFVKHMCSTPQAVIDAANDIKKHADMEMKSNQDAIDSSLYN